MRTHLVSLFIAIQVFAPSAIADGNDALFIKELSNYSDGIVSPRADVSPANYNTQYSAVLTKQQQQIESIYRKLYGIDQIDSKEFVTKAKAIYLLEHEIALYLQNIPSKTLSSFDRKSLTYRGIQAYKSLRTAAEQTYDNTLRLIDIALPGPGGPQIRLDLKKSFALYEPNYRSDSPLNDSQKDLFYKEKIGNFIADGGSLSEIKVLMSSDSVNDSKEFSSYEYVQAADGEIRLTSGLAGHLLLAEGRSVRAAGSIAIVRSAEGKILLLVVSNSSGTFKPDIYSAEQAARKIARTLKVSSDQLIVTRGEPFGLQNLKILLKAQGISKSEIESQLKQLQNKVTVARAILANGRCENIFKLIEGVR